MVKVDQDEEGVAQSLRAQLSEKEAALKAALIEAMQLRESMGADEVGFASMLVAKDRWQHRAIAAEKALAENDAELVALRDERDGLNVDGWQAAGMIVDLKNQLAAKDAEIAKLKEGTAWRTALNESEKRELIALAELEEANAEIARLRKMLDKETK